MSRYAVTFGKACHFHSNMKIKRLENLYLFFFFLCFLNSWAQTICQTFLPVQQLPHGPLQSSVWRHVEALWTHQRWDEEDELLCTGGLPQTGSRFFFTQAQKTCRAKIIPTLLLYVHFLVILRLQYWWQITSRSTKTSWSSSCRSSAASLRPWTQHIRNCPLQYEDMDSLQPYVHCLFDLIKKYFTINVCKCTDFLVCSCFFYCSHARKFAHKTWTWCTRSSFSAVSRCIWLSLTGRMTASTSCPASWTL